MNADRSRSRRDFFANLLMLVALLPGIGIVAKYVVKFLVPRTRDRVEQVLIGTTGAFPVGASRALDDVYGNDLIVVRVSEDEIKVFSSICTHLGCRVHWDQVEGNFLCPCHMGRFNTDGEVIQGPPPEPLPRFAVEKEGENLFVAVPVKEA